MATKGIIFTAQAPDYLSVEEIKKQWGFYEGRRHRIPLAHRIARFFHRQESKAQEAW